MPMEAEMASDMLAISKKFSTLLQIDKPPSKVDHDVE